MCNFIPLFLLPCADAGPGANREMYVQIMLAGVTSWLSPTAACVAEVANGGSDRLYSASFLSCIRLPHHPPVNLSCPLCCTSLFLTCRVSIFQLVGSLHY